MPIDDPQQLTFIIGELYAMRRVDLQRLADLESENNELKMQVNSLQAELSSSAYTIQLGDDDENSGRHRGYLDSHCGHPADLDDSHMVNDD